MRRVLLPSSAARALPILFAASLAVGGCSASGQQKRTPQTPEAGFVVMKGEPVSPPIILAGRTAAFESSEVRPQVSGIIKARQFTEGSIVHAGQTLYQIDPSIYQASADQARANLASAQAAQAAAQTLADRYKPLADMEAVSKQDYTNALAQARQAAASVAQNRAQVSSAQINLRFTRVPAPITGRIGRSLVTTGGLVTANQAEPLTTIQRLDPMFVDIQQSSADLLALRRSMMNGGTAPASTSARLTLEDGSAYPYAGTLEFAEAVVDPATGTVTLRARFPNPQGLLLPGMYVRATVTQSTVADAILVPQTSVTRDPQGNASVMLVGADNKAVKRKITTTRSIGTAWLATAGLKPGDKVIVEGLGKIRPGAKIIPVAAGSKPRPRTPAPSAKS